MHSLYHNGIKDDCTYFDCSPYLLDLQWPSTHDPTSDNLVFYNSPISPTDHATAGQPSFAWSSSGANSSCLTVSSPSTVSPAVADQTSIVLNPPPVPESPRKLVISVPETGYQDKPRLCTRSPNAFLLFRCNLAKQFARRGDDRVQQEISRVAGDMWRNTPDVEKARWFEMAQDRMNEHMKNRSDLNVSPKRTKSKKKQGLVPKGQKSHPQSPAKRKTTKEKPVASSKSSYWSSYGLYPPPFLPGHGTPFYPDGLGSAQFSAPF